MATRVRAGVQTRAASKCELDVCLGKAERPLGRLVYVKDGQTEFSQFAYREEWLGDPLGFDISPDLARVPGYQAQKPRSRDDSCFFLALADTQPDGWGRRVIARAHAKARARDASLGSLSAVDHLTAVDDFSRVGALRLRDADGNYLRSAGKGERTPPPLLELDKIVAASRAVELSREGAEDLAYLQGKATSLGGLRPKCTVLDEDGALALGKFPSVQDERTVTRGEVLALRLARHAGIESADARIVMVQETPVAIVRRFDRTSAQTRIPYLSGAAMLQADRGEERAYTELVDAMRSRCHDFAEDARQLWRRLAFNHLITNVDDHLRNIGFLYDDRNHWRLSPAFDLNPFPDKERESKTWLSEDTGPITSVRQLVDQATRFLLGPAECRRALAEVVRAVSRWRELATAPPVGMTPRDLEDFAPAFEHAELEAAQALAA